MNGGNKSVFVSRYVAPLPTKMNGSVSVSGTGSAEQRQTSSRGSANASVLETDAYQSPLNKPPQAVPSVNLDANNNRAFVNELCSDRPGINCSAPWNTQPG